MHTYGVQTNWTLNILCLVKDLKFSEEEDPSDKNFGGRNHFSSKTGTGKTTVTSPTLSYSTSYTGKACFCTLLFYTTFSQIFARFSGSFVKDQWPLTDMSLIFLVPFPPFFCFV